jgi:hypothetical protein
MARARLSRGGGVRSSSSCEAALKGIGAGTPGIAQD